jgi:predicted short-subunit dehydrogenase-like oxidoreductase (DUF2520 family)
MRAPRLNLLGAGKLGQTLALLWHRAGVLRIGGVCNRSLASAQAAVQLIGAGRAVARVDELPAAEFTLIGTPDGQIAAAAQTLAQAGVIRAGDVLFHASGALTSELLEPLRERGALIASVHPIRAFAEPLAAAANFSPTFCGAEGDAEALAGLEPLFAAIGGELLRIDPAGKTRYHAAAVIASNYLVALVELSLQNYAAAGVAREDAQRLLAPILAGTLDNIARRGTAAALTGPIARGDAATVAQHLAVLDADDADAAASYRALGRQALALAQQAGGADAAGLARIAELLETGR